MSSEAKVLRIGKAGRLLDDPAIAAPPNPREFQVKTSHTTLSDHADGVFAFLFAPIMGHLSQLYSYLPGFDLQRIQWSDQGRKRLTQALVNAADRDPIFRPGSFPGLAGLIRSDWFSLYGIDGPESEVLEAVRDFEASRQELFRACAEVRTREKTAMKPPPRNPSRKASVIARREQERALAASRLEEAVARETQARLNAKDAELELLKTSSVGIRCSDGGTWQLYSRQPELVDRVSERLRADQRVHLEIGTIELWSLSG